MNPNQEAELTGGGDCFLHHHSADQAPSQELLHGLQMVASQKPISSDTTLVGTEDFVLVDTTAQSLNITLPRAINGLEREIMKLVNPNTIVVLPQGTDTILGTSGVTISSGGASLRFKAIGTDWRPI